MTDKVQKIREEVERLMNELIQEKEKGFGSDSDDACILELQNVLTYIDTLQEEPKKKCMYSNDNYTDEDRKVLCDGCEEECKYARKEADWLQELQCKLDSMSKEDFEQVWKKYETEAVSDDEIEKQFKAGDVVVYVSRQPAYSGLYLLGNPNDLSIGYSNANEPYQIALINCTVVSEDERKQFMRELDSNGYEWNENTLRIEKVEPVGEDLEREVSRYINENDLQKLDNIRISDGFVYVKVNSIEDIARHFTEWQRKKIMKDAVETDVLDDGVDLLTTESWDEMSQYLHKIDAKAGDKVKICLIKEE